MQVAIYDNKQTKLEKVCNFGMLIHNKLYLENYEIDYVIKSK